MREGDILDRLGDKGIIVREPLHALEVEKFLTDLLKSFIDQDEVSDRIAQQSLATTPENYPFTPDGREAFLREAAAMPDRAVPRTIIRALTSCAIETLRRDEPLINDDVVDAKAPQEFLPSRV